VSTARQHGPWTRVPFWTPVNTGHLHVSRVVRSHNTGDDGPLLITRHRATTSMYSLTFRVRRYVVMCTDCHYARRYVVIATKPVHRSRIRPIVHNSGTPPTTPNLHPGPCSSVGMRPRTDRHRQIEIRA